MDKKIVVTGIGIQSCLGNNIKDYWDSLSNGRSGIRTITQVSSADFPCKVSGEVQNFEPGEWMNPKEAKAIVCCATPTTLREATLAVARITFLVVSPASRIATSP